LEGTHSGPWYPGVSEVLFTGDVVAAYREGDLKVRMQYAPIDGPQHAKGIQVFDLSEDPSERTPLAPVSGRAKRIVFRAVRTHRRDWLERSGKAPRQIHRDDVPDLDEDAAARLRALGYIN
jgi:hypothetical protein